jgi:thiamine biosynthesis lipoprotein
MSERFSSMGCEIEVDGDPVPVRRIFEADHARFTPFEPGSELMRVNAHEAPLVVSERFARSLRAALRAWRQTDGLVDCTLDGRAGELRIAGRLLTKPPGVRLDLNGVVKSMAVDDALATGANWVSGGGDVATRRPLEIALPAEGAIRLESGALATSGTNKRGRHLIDPRAGEPAESPWEQVTVCGATCLMADVAAKAAFLLGDAGPSWLDARGMPGRFVRADGSIHVNGVWAACI